MSAVDENDVDPNVRECAYCSEFITSSAWPHHADACGNYPKSCDICGIQLKQQNFAKHRKEHHPGLINYYIYIIYLFLFCFFFFNFLTCFS